MMLRFVAVPLTLSLAARPAIHQLTSKVPESATSNSQDSLTVQPPADKASFHQLTLSPDARPANHQLTSQLLERVTSSQDNMLV
jgi:hypothetical protein